MHYTIVARWVTRGDGLRNNNMQQPRFRQNGRISTTNSGYTGLLHGNIFAEEYSNRRAWLDWWLLEKRGTDSKKYLWLLPEPFKNPFCEGTVNVWPNRRLQAQRFQNGKKFRFVGNAPNEEVSLLYVRSVEHKFQRGFIFYPAYCAPQKPWQFCC